MRNAQLALRYARALYNLAKESNQQDIVFTQMRALSESFSGDAEVVGFLQSPLINVADKIKVIETAIAKAGLADPLLKFVMLLARKDRLGIFGETVTAFEKLSDEANGVTRGIVRSAAVLAPEERKRIEDLVSKATKKQVILTYKEDPSLLGGLVAEVGSFTFDDSLTSHLKRINEQLTRNIT